MAFCRHLALLMLFPTMLGHSLQPCKQMPLSESYECRGIIGGMTFSDDLVLMWTRSRPLEAMSRGGRALAYG